MRPRWIRPVPLAFASLLCACNPPGKSAAPPDHSKDLAAIEELHQADMRAVVAGDTATLMSLWTDDIVSLPPLGPIQVGREKNAALLRAGMAQSKEFKPVDYRLNFQEVRIFGETAVEWGTYSGRVQPVKGGAEITSRGKLMRVLRRQPDGSWKVARTIFTADP